MGGTLTLPVWLIPVLVTLGLATVGALWRTAAELSDATRRLLAMEARIAAIATLETAAAVVRTQLDAALAEILAQRQRIHDLSTHCTVTRGAVDALAGRVSAVEGDVRLSLHPSRP